MPGTIAAIAAVVVGLWGGVAAAADIQMTIPCQQNLSDGRILVDGSLLPAQARYKVLHYTPAQQESGWSRGSCRLLITKGASG